MEKDNTIKEPQSIEKKPRLDFLDFAKCIAIFLVIWGHTTGNLDRPLYRVVLYSFHMPLFFLVSGIVISNRNKEFGWKYWKTFLFKNIMALLVPYLIWGAIYSAFAYSNFVKLFYGSWEIINTAETLTSLWYLPCLFVARILAELVFTFIPKVKPFWRYFLPFLIAICSFVISYLLPKFDIGYPLCINVAFMALGFILVGYSLRSFILKLPRAKWWPYLLLTIFFGGLLTFGILIQGEEPFLMLMCKAEYGNPLYFFLNSFAGIGLIMCFSIFLSVIFKDSKDNKIKAFMLWTGQNTIGIYLLHKPFLQEIIMPMISSWGVTLPNTWWSLLGTVFAFIFSVIACFIINRYVPSLFGRFKIEKKAQ